MKIGTVVSEWLLCMAFITFFQARSQNVCENLLLTSSCAVVWDFLLKIRWPYSVCWKSGKSSRHDESSFYFRCDGLSMGEWFPMSQRILILSFSRLFRNVGKNASRHTAGVLNNAAARTSHHVLTGALHGVHKYKFVFLKYSKIFFGGGGGKRVEEK